MKFELVEIDELSGPKCAIYSLLVDDDQETLFARFVHENMGRFRNEVADIITRLANIAELYGAQEEFLKLHEGEKGDNICALYDDPGSHLRLYCIHFGPDALIIGNGGHKPKTIRAYQEDPKLDAKVNLLKDFSRCLTKAMSQQAITFDGFLLEGQFVFDTDEL